MVGHLLHYHHALIKMKNLIKEGKIGKIKYITSNRKSLGIYRTFENVLWSFGVHDISVALSLCKKNYEDIENSNNSVLFEDLSEITCSGKSIITKDVHDIINTTFTVNDIYVNINVDWCSPIKEQRLTVVGEKGILVFDDVNKENKLTYYKDFIKIENNLPVSNKIEENIPIENLMVS
jgi:UDP-2-acetamido-3-amino-2,3-dideoxy-glucuronate N-acetyltransferase